MVNVDVPGTSTLTVCCQSLRLPPELLSILDVAGVSPEGPLPAVRVVAACVSSNGLLHRAVDGGLGPALHRLQEGPGEQGAHPGKAREFDPEEAGKYPDYYITEKMRLSIWARTKRIDAPICAIGSERWRRTYPSG